MDHRALLEELLIERSVRIGDFTLASGARSSYYVDARRTTMTARGQFLTGRVLLDLVSGSDWRPTHVGGLTLGADPVTYAIAHASWIAGSPLDGFTVRKRTKTHGTAQRIEGGLPADARAVVVEDSVTTGSSALEALDAVLEHGASVVGVLALVDREEGGRERIEARGHRLLSAFRGRELRDAARRRGA